MANAWGKYYTMFLNDNYASFLLVIKQTFGKTSESLKIFWKWLSLNFFLLTISFLTAKFDKCSLIYARIYFISPKSVLKNTWKFFNTKFQPQSKKNRKIGYQEGKILVLFCNLAAPIRCWRRVRGLTATKNAEKKKTIQGVLVELQ